MSHDDWDSGPKPTATVEKKKDTRGRDNPPVQRSFSLADGYELLFTLEPVFGPMKFPAKLYKPALGWRPPSWHQLDLDWIDAIEEPPTIPGLYLVSREKLVSVDIEYVMCYYCTARKTWFERKVESDQERWFAISHMRLSVDNYVWAGIPPQLAQQLGLDKQA